MFLHLYLQCEVCLFLINEGEIHLAGGIAEICIIWSLCSSTCPYMFLLWNYWTVFNEILVWEEYAKNCQENEILFASHGKCEKFSYRFELNSDN
jgi:hypothetical protein